MKIVTLLLFLVSAVLAASETENPIVEVQQGSLKGSWKISTKGRNYASFQGIPYAKAPIGELRFKPPQTLKSWPGVWEATKLLSPCLQHEPIDNQTIGSEDCLFVNVYTPKLKTDKLLPVMIFIHGGAFLYGTGNLYDPSNLMDWDMVVVTLNYRLGPIGFLSTGDSAAPGNYGLKDQAFALQWVQKNIKQFGGDPTSVTLTGCSAGGASVTYHYLSPLSEGTFSRGIAYSGSALAPWTHATKPLPKAQRLASLVGCPINNNPEMIECLRARPGEAIIDAQIKMFDWKVHLFGMFTPTIESPDSEKPFITQYPYITMKTGAMKKLPFITSVTSEEGLYPAAAYQTSPELLPELEKRWEELASSIFEYNDTLPENLRQSVAAKIKQHYLGGKPVSQETYPQLVQALGDRLFVVPVSKMAQLHAQNSGQPVYFYRYAFRGDISFSYPMAENRNNYGVSHGDDIMIHIFNYPDLVSKLPDDYKITEKLINIIYSFSTTGIPKIAEGQEWIPVTPGSKELNYLEISSPTSFQMKLSSDFGYKSLWDNLGILENENYVPKIKEEL